MVVIVSTYTIITISTIITDLSFTTYKQMLLNSPSVWLFLVIAGISFFACEHDTPTDEGADPLLATVQNKSLNLSE